MSAPVLLGDAAEVAGAATTATLTVTTGAVLVVAVEAAGDAGSTLGDPVVTDGLGSLTWALTHAMWQCRTARKKIVRRGEVAAGDDDDGRVIDGSAQAIERELVRSAVATLATLGPRDVEVLVASLTDDDNVRSTLAPATFRKRLERAMTRLRTSWRARHGVL